MRTQSSFSKKDKGHLHLIPTPINNLEDITLRARRILTEADYIATKDTRTSGILLEEIGVYNRTISFHKYNSKERAPKLIKLLKEGNTIAEISDAGMPVIPDPDYILVQEYIRNDIPVVSLPGPSAFVTALIVSGSDTQPSTYYDFLPRKSNEQGIRFEVVNQTRVTSIFYEAPHRLKKTLKTLAEVIKPGRKIVLARELTKIHEEYLRDTVNEVNEYFTKNDPRGEFVVSVSPGDEREKQLSWDELIKQVANRVEAGESKKDTIKLIAKASKVSKNKLYDKYHRN